MTMENPMNEKPLNKARQTIIDRYYDGDVEAYNEGMRIKASKGGKAKVTKGRNARKAIK